MNDDPMERNVDILQDKIRSLTFALQEIRAQQKEDFDRAAALREALRLYGQHAWECASLEPEEMDRSPDSSSCTCGLASLLKDSHE